LKILNVKDAVLFAALPALIAFILHQQVALCVTCVDMRKHA
jgi:hypothetical protein